MTAIPSSALLGQFACDITPAGQAVFGLKAQPFTDNHGAVLGEVFDAERGNVSLALARKASLVAECHRLGLNAAGTAATLRAVLQRSNTRVLTQIAADWAAFSDADVDGGLTDPSGAIDISTMDFSTALIEITRSVAVAPVTDDAAFAAASVADQAGLLRLAKHDGGPRELHGIGGSRHSLGCANGYSIGEHHTWSTRQTSTQPRYHLRSGPNV